MPITLSEINTRLITAIVTNYSALPAASTVNDTFYWVQSDQGTKWLPGSIGGTFYPKGVYYSDGTNWEYAGVPNQASQVLVNAGIDTEAFVTSFTLKNAAQWNTKVSSVTGTGVDNTDPLNPIVNIPAVPSVTITVIENIAQYDAVNSDGSKANNSLITKRNKVIGIAKLAIANGFSGDVQQNGTITNTGWSFVKGDNIFLNGTSLSPTAPSTGFTQMIGKAINNNTIEININQAVRL